MLLPPVLEPQRDRIALFLYSLDGGGAERVMVNLAGNFAERGFKVDMVLVKAKGPYLTQLSPKVRVVDLQASKTPAAFPHLVGYLSREKPTVLISTMHYANEIALFAKQFSGVTTRVVVCEQNTLSLYAQKTSRWAEKFTPLWAKLLYPLSDKVVAASQGVATDLQRVTNLPRDRIQVIYNPVITPELFTKAKAALEHPWFTPDAPPVILGVGRLVAQKDFPTLIRAFARVRSLIPSRLMILGNNGGSGPSLQALIQELNLDDDVLMPGFVDNPYVYMARAAVFVLSSRWEGFGNVIAEALAVGTPVVSTDCESGPMEILANGQYGELVPVGDLEAMAKAILRVLSGQRKPVPPEWLNQFSLETVTQQYLNIMGLNA